MVAKQLQETGGRTQAACWGNWQLAGADRLRGLLVSEMPHREWGGSHPPGGCPPSAARPGAPGEAGRAALWGPEHREAGRGARVSVADFSMENFAPGSSPPLSGGPRDTGKCQREWVKLKIQNFAHPSRGQSHGLVGAVWRRKLQALQPGSPPLFIACCGQGYPVSDQRVLRPALAQKAAAPELLEDLLPARAVQVGGTTCRMGGSSGGEGKACCQATDGWRGGSLQGPYPGCPPGHAVGRG